MDFTEHRDQHFRKWQKKISRICWIGSTIVLVVELLIFFLFWNSNTLNRSPESYLLIRIICPSGINFLTSLALALILKKIKITPKQGNYCASFAVLICCSTVAIFHTAFEFLLMSLTLPVFICTIFGDQKLLKHLAVFDVLAFGIAATVLLTESQNNTIFEVVSVLSLAALVGISFLIANALVRTQLEHLKFIYKSYKKQLDLIHALKIEPFTQLYNKNALEGCMNAYLRKYEENIFDPTLVMIDIDHFKAVNDTYGHESGDIVLLTLADIIKEQMDGIRHAFRFGGEEFVLIFEKEDREYVLNKVQTIKDIFCEATYDFAEGLHFSFSAGVAKPQHGWDRSQWFNATDSALYNAKETGRNKIVEA
ncbi:MAG: GGDEF domain-containing protein [Treponema sp.]|nr:GGDEF domain-containing protein [Candidatus Treponema equifaecale]